MRNRLALLLILAATAGAQGPKVEYLADPRTELAFAECHVYMNGGSRHKIAFLPVVNFKRAPCGTERYTRDIRVRAPLVLAGSGAGDEAYKGLEVAGKAVLLPLDGPAAMEDRVRDAAARKAAAVVLFSMAEEHPFPMFREEAPERMPEIPVIAIGKSATDMVLASAGRVWQADKPIRPAAMISKLDLRIDGKFELIETGNFTFAFEPRGIPREAATALAETAEKAVRFDLDLFRTMEPRWKKSFAAYFGDFDSKVFFVHHWGSGLASDAGLFMVYDGKTPDFALAAHETAHKLIAQNWGGSSSFLAEGLGKYAEAMATDKAKNHRETAANLKAGTLLPLEQMAKIDIGSHSATGIAYPAAGSFVHYLIEKHSLGRLKIAYQGGGHGEAWVKAYGKGLPELEREWLEYLRSR